VVAGPTGTNVNDLKLLLRAVDSAGRNAGPNRVSRTLDNSALRRENSCGGRHGQRTVRQGEEDWLMERALGVIEAREQISPIGERVQLQGDSYVTSRNGKPAAAAVPVEAHENRQRQKGLSDLIRNPQKLAGPSPHEADRVADEIAAATRAER
jgi:hypothetical protein